MTEIPFGASFHWNPYTPKHFTVVTRSPSSSATSSVGEQSISVADDEEYDLGWATVSALRCESTEAVLLHNVRRLPPKTLAAVRLTLEASPLLVRELCEKERGAIVIQLIHVAGPDACCRLIAEVIDFAVALAYSQSGCVALTRIYDIITPLQQTVFARAVMTRFVELAAHPFGNYVIQRVLEGASLEVYVSALNYLIRHELVDTLTCNKFGSHVLEVFMKHAPGPLVLSVCSAVIRDADSVMRLGFDRIGNYTLQAMLRQLLVHADTTNGLATWCHQVIPTLVASSPYALNISRSLGYQSTRSEAARRS